MLVFDHIWIFILLPLPWLVMHFSPPLQKETAMVRVPFLKRISNAAAKEHAVGRHSKQWKNWLVWIFILLALAKPQRLEPPIEKQIPTRDLLLMVDLSGSMDAEDFTNAAGEKTDRLTAAKEVVGEFLINRAGDRVGLVVFGNAPYLQAPFSTDLEVTRVLLNETAVRMAGPRTALGDAIGLGINLFNQSDAPAKTIIALTDGNDTASALPPEEAAKIARDRGITVHTIAMGDPKTIGEEKLDEEVLKKTAAATGGKFFQALDRAALETIYTELDRIETREIKTISHQPRTDLYFWPLSAALFCSLWIHIPKKQVLAKPSQAKRLRVDVQTAELKVVES